MRIWTIGHSNQTIDRFLDGVRGVAIGVIADVRRYPGSRRHPHFGREHLAASLTANQIAYVHLPELGGRRAARKNSPNIAWRNDAFRGYADYMETQAFAAGIQRLLAVAAERRTAIMCAEARWWQCHRGLIADYLKAHGHDVIHIVAAGKNEPHPYTSAAALVNGELSYRGLI